MNGRDIPGFYYDPEKKKYFKIQKAYHAPRPGSRYTQENVKNEQRKQQADENASIRQRKAQKETIIRRCVQDPLMLATLDRELGLRRSSYYRHLLWPGACASKLTQIPELLPENDDFDRHVSNSTSTYQPPPRSYFDRDPVTKTVYATRGNDIARHRRPESCEDGSHHGLWASPWEGIARLTSPIACLAYLPGSGAVAAATMGSDRSPVIYFSDPDVDGPYVAQQFTPKDVSTIWGLAARPLSFSSPSATSSIPQLHTEHVAVATSKGLITFTRSQSGSWDSTMALKTDVDIKAVEWLSNTVVALGCRNGKILLYDTRSEGSSHILTHPSCISRIKRADDATRIVCSGLQDTLCLYDIRSSKQTRTPSVAPSQHPYSDLMANPPHHRSDRKKRRKTRNTAFQDWSQPILTFQHMNHEHPDLDIDVHPEFGLLAAAQNVDSSRTAIKIHNLWTGKIVKEMPTEPSTGQIRCLKFMESESGGFEIWSTWNGGIGNFSWE